jgi:hypothetical protein
MFLLSMTFANQTDFSTSHTDTSWQFSYAWEDYEKVDHRLKFSLPTSAVQEDLEIGTRFPRGAMLDAQVAAVEAYAAGLKGQTKLKVWKENGGLQFKVTATSSKAAKAAIAGAQEVAETALEAWLPANGYIKDANDSILPDHIALAQQYQDVLAPVVAALKPEAGERAFTDLLLSFLQTIPYEKRPNGNDTGYRRPLSILARNKGDCDSKATLFLSVFHAAFPETEAAIVYIKNHAFAAVALEPESGDFSFSKGGVRYLIAEPVGPGLFTVGDGDKKSKKKLRWGNYELREL